MLLNSSLNIVFEALIWLSAFLILIITWILTFNKQITSNPKFNYPNHYKNIKNKESRIKCDIISNPNSSESSNCLPSKVESIYSNPDLSNQTTWIELLENYILFSIMKKRNE